MLCEVIEKSLKKFPSELDLKEEILSSYELFEGQKERYSDSTRLTILLQLYIAKVKKGDLPKFSSKEEVIEKLKPIQKKLMSLLSRKIIERLDKKEKELIEQLLPEDQLEFHRLSRQISSQYAAESKKLEASLYFNLKVLVESNFSSYNKTKKDKDQISLFENLFELENLVSK
jgi:hypothetical protein